MISVVLPTYNGERYIKDSIDSILNQTYADFELIIVDDCSTDETGNILENYKRKDNRIKVIHNQVNMNLPKSLNIGFKHARGEFYTWTSDDNIFHPIALETLASKILDENVDLVFSDYKLIDEDGYVLGEMPMGPTEKLPRDDVIGACFLYKNTVDRKIGGYNEELFGVEDYDFFLRAYRYFNFYHISQPLYYYRIHSKSLTSTKRRTILERGIKVREDNVAFINNTEIKLSVIERINSMKKELEDM